MVLVRHPLYVAVGAAVAAYGVVYALDTGLHLLAALYVAPGGWLVAHGLLNGIALAVADARGGAGHDGGSATAGDDGRDGGGGGDGDDGDDENGDANDDEPTDLSAGPLARAPY